MSSIEAARAERQYLERFDEEWRKGDRDLAKDLACEYVEANFDRLAATLAGYDLSGLVRLIEQYREAGRGNDRIVVDMWILSQYEPQSISGKAELKLPLTLAKGESNGRVRG